MIDLQSNHGGMIQSNPKEQNAELSHTCLCSINGVVPVDVKVHSFHMLAKSTLSSFPYFKFYLHHFFGGGDGVWRFNSQCACFYLYERISE